MEPPIPLLTVTVFPDGSCQMTASLEEGRVRMDPDLARKVTSLAFISSLSHTLPEFGDYITARQRQLHGEYSGPAQETWRQIAIRDILTRWIQPMLQDYLQQLLMVDPKNIVSQTRIMRKDQQGEDTGYRAN